MIKNGLIEELIKNKIIDKEEQQIYQFGLECIVIKMTNCLALLAITLIMNRLSELIYISLAFVPLRRSAGGYHAKTCQGCFVFSCGALIITFITCSLLNNEIIWFALVLAANIIILLLAPLDNENKKMNMQERKIFRRKTLCALVVVGCVSLCCDYFGMKVQGQQMFAGICLEEVVLILGKCMNN